MSETDDHTWLPVCPAGDIEIGTPIRVETPGLPPLAVFRLADGFYVTNDTCTHGEASLCDGFVDGDEVECPFHSGGFCIKDGNATAYPAIEPIKVYRTRVLNDQVCINSEQDPS